MIRIGIIGSGFIAKGFYFFTLGRKDLKVTNFLTRTPPKSRNDLPKNLLTNDLQKVIKNSDIILECSGDTIHATNCLFEIMNSEKLPVVTMNSELHITTGRYFYDKMCLVEAEGDQSGCLFKFDFELKEMGFTPLVYGNYKSYLKYNVPLQQAQYWANKNGISLEKTISFTDGSKVEIENVFVANSLNADFYDERIYGNKKNFLSNRAISNKTPYIDFFLDSNAPRGVFITATHNKQQKDYLEYLKINTKFHTFERPFHLCHLEIIKTIKEVLTITNFKGMQNTNRKYMVCCLTKKPIKAGEKIKLGLGSVEIRGIHHKYNKMLLPITLANNIIVKHNLPKDYIIRQSDVHMDESLALNIWNENVK